MNQSCTPSMFIHLPTSTPSPIPTPPQIDNGIIYYVSVNGSDANPGSFSQPWRTIRKATNTVRAGDAVYVRGGTYQEKVSVSKTASANAPITISSYPNELAIIDGSNSMPGGGNISASLVSITGAYVTFQNFEVRNSTGRCVQLSGAGSKAIGNNVHHCMDIGLYIAGSSITADSNKVWRASENNYNHAASSWSGGLAWGAAGSPNTASNAVIKNNFIYQNSGEGLLCMYTDNALVEGNTVYDNWAMNMYLDQCSTTTIKNNYVYYTTDKQFWKNADAPKGGIVIANENNQSYPMGHDRTIVNNLLVNNGDNFGFWVGRLAGASLSNDTIANNTLVNAYIAGIGIDSAPHVNTKIINNIVVQNSGSAAQVSGGGITFSNNLWYPNNGITGAGDLRINPMLSADYKLPSTSPACTGGLNGTYIGAFPCAVVP
jgi:parallel beta-helix repeat protein